MIYEYPDHNEPIKQGDIFYPLPLLILDLNKLILLSEEKFEQTIWKIVKNDRELVLTVSAKSTYGIVASQDCDIIRAPILSLFEIASFKDVTGLESPKNPEKWVSLITKRARLNARWFYLPDDGKIGFKDRMAINFQNVFQISKENLEYYSKELRIGRLNKIALEHYRESIAHYFRRYPYDEWYPLKKDEFEVYNKDKGPVKPFEWQK